ncbi:unnamed protein product [Soboliphyme baturini]|uniref:Aminotran_5 domain-containing protein n=1 Tax=Soboliphyme baturini TaxID=241478 RepID=A0A183IE22_9BILA|nr:unnamed protein product [Soboliphyme baturini]
MFRPALPLFFKEDPLMVCRAFRQYLYDENGNRYLDCINNVQHVGHCHPAVTNAIMKQSSLSTLNNRYLHSSCVEYCERLSATLPSSLNTFLFCNSGSEANDVAFRMARDYTGGTEVIVLEHAYHGNLSSLIDISPLKFNGKGGKGAPEHVHVAPIPDAYRGKIRLTTEKLHDPASLEDIGVSYALEVKAICDKIKNDGKKLCAFYMESLISCGGQVIPPSSYLYNVLKYVFIYILQSMY